MKGMSIMDDKFNIELQPSDVFDIQLQNVVSYIGGLDNYEDLKNKPKINDVVLIGNKSLKSLGIQPEGDYPAHALTNDEIDAILN